MSTASYAFLSFKETEMLLPAIDGIARMEAVRRWYAVEGHYHLALLLGETGEESEAELRAIPGVSELMLCPISEEIQEAPGELHDETYAFVIIEFDEKSRAALETELPEILKNHWRSLAFCECCIVGILAGEHFEQIDAVINGILRPLDGILRLKRDWIIDLTKL